MAPDEPDDLVPGDETLGEDVDAAEELIRAKIADDLVEGLADEDEELEHHPAMDLVRVNSAVPFEMTLSATWALLPLPDSESWVLQLAVYHAGETEPDGIQFVIDERQRHAWRKLSGEKVRERFLAGLFEKMADTLADELYEGAMAATGEIVTRKGNRLVREVGGPVAAYDPAQFGEGDRTAAEVNDETEI